MKQPKILKQFKYQNNTILQDQCVEIKTENSVIQCTIKDFDKHYLYVFICINNHYSLEAAIKWEYVDYINI